MKIDTLIPDIKEILAKGIPKDQIDPEKARLFGENLTKTVVDSLTDRDRPATLRMSNIGKPSRQLWYEINMPEKKEKLLPETYMKFLIGHLIEELALFLADLAGHSVEGRQSEQVVEGVKGHRDVVLDGMTADVKSASKFGFQKFEEHKLLEDDPFGYMDQMDGYVEAGQTDPVVTDKENGAFLAIAKESGKMTLDVYPRRTNPDIKAVYNYKKKIVELPEPPERCFEPVPFGKSGNMKLGTTCSYCSFKQECHPGLRTFIYSSGPVFLTEVTREPDVPEILHAELEE